MIEIIAYTDGSAVVRGVNKGNGGFGTYFPDLYGEKKAWSLGFKQAKTGGMEVMALLYAIKAINTTHKEQLTLTVYSDSEYVVKTFTENRLERWIRNGWRNTSGDVKNKETWEAIVNALNNRKFLTLNMIHIKGHQVDREKDKEKKKELMKNPHILGNMMADMLADYKRHKILL